MLWAGHAVAVPIPGAVAFAPEVDVLAIAGPAPRWPAEFLSMEVGKQLARPVAAIHGYHHFATPPLRECVEAAKHDGVFVNDDNFFVSDVHFYYAGDDGAQF